MPYHTSRQRIRSYSLLSVRTDGPLCLLLLEIR